MLENGAETANATNEMWRSAIKNERDSKEGNSHCLFSERRIKASPNNVPMPTMKPSIIGVLVAV